MLLLHSISQLASPGSSQATHRDPPVTYAHYYRYENTRPNICKIAHRAVRPLNGTSGYVPFIGTSIGRDPQQLVLRLYYSTLEYPVKNFVVVIPERALSPPHGAIWYEVQHLKEYADNVVIITCTHTPSVAEGWNAVFQAFPDEAWGIYCARDTAWMPGSLQKLAGHMWNASRDNSMEVVLMNWTYPIGLGMYNAFGLTRTALGRFGLFDENIYPAFYEDNDFQIRQARMQPPLRVTVLSDVIMQHGKQNEQSYTSGVHTADDPNRDQQERHMRSFWQQRADINKAYLLRKWGCQGRNFGGCRYQTPFNKSLPVWYWATSRHQRALDHGLFAKDNTIFDGDGNAVYTIPKDDNYIGWAGYNESAHVCRITGPSGIVAHNSSVLWCI
ncbi:hypothetical protein OEZ86_004357 [Tetradesmus obliquus]|nr:hypothetical protein OEZ86_004354 [Tetradesmus obliquus]WIA35980.1 hypothetical protein OEZ86_004357 [Tetradesmus obliquus]